MSAPKQNGSRHFNVEIQKLNAVTKRDVNSIPRMDYYIESFVKAKLFFTLDENSRYWKVKMAIRNWGKVAFTSHHVLYRFMQISFRIQNALRTFKRTINVAPSAVNCQLALVYFGNIDVFSRSVEENIDHARHVQALSRNAGVTLKLKNAAF